MKTTIKIITLTLLGLTFTSSAALTEFRWWNTAANNLLNNVDSAIATGDATVLTYLSSDNTINFDAGVLLATTYGNDFFYQALGNLAPGRLATTYMTEPDGGTDYAGWYAYAVVLDMSLVTFTTTYGGDVTQVPAGTFYDVTTYFGGLTDMDPIGPPATADSFNAGNIKTSTQVVPEPATALLFGIGGIGAFIVRRNKKAKEEADA